MKKFSVWSIWMVIVGGVLVILSGILENQVEVIFLLGIMVSLIGVIYSFIAFIKQDESILKYVSFCFFFLILFWISWFQPFQFVRVLSWLKNMT